MTRVTVSFRLHLQLTRPGCRSCGARGGTVVGSPRTGTPWRTSRTMRSREATIMAVIAVVALTAATACSQPGEGGSDGGGGGGGGGGGNSAAEAELEQFLSPPEGIPVDQELEACPEEGKTIVVTE